MNGFGDGTARQSRELDIGTNEDRSDLEIDSFAMYLVSYGRMGIID